MRCKGLKYFCSLITAALLLPVYGITQTEILQRKTLSPEEYLSIVRAYHPVAKQGALLVDLARAELLSARGLFDPSIYFTRDRKVFDGKTYYDYQQTSFKLPTWFGIEVQAGLDNIGGDLVTDEETLGRSSYAGLSVPLAKNLLMDQRRAALKQAKFFIDQSRAEQQLIINDLLYDAVYAYWDWARAWNVYNIITNTLNVSQQRYAALRITVEQGDRAGVDSTEALTQLLTFQSMQVEAYNEFLAAGFEMSNYLWVTQNTPYTIDSTVIPSVKTEEVDVGDFPFSTLTDLLAVATASHPKLNATDSKLDILEVERQLKFQSLLPSVNVKYNGLAKGYDFYDGLIPPNDNFYKFGLEIGMPLFLRQGRGQYRQARIKIENTQLDRQYLTQTIANKVREYYNNLVTQLQQVRIQEQAVQAYQKMFDVEKLRFEIGESSLFLINTRETKLLEAKQKLAELKAKFFNSLYGVQWAAGALR